MAESFLRDLRAAALAGVPIVCVVTHEERRARALLGEAFHGRRVIAWTSTEGWMDRARRRKATRSPRWRRARTSFDTGRRARDVRSPCVAGRRARRARAPATSSPAIRTFPLILVMPTAGLPPELDRDASHPRRYPFPTARVGSALGPRQPRWAATSGRVRRATRSFRAAKGLTPSDEARRAFRYGPPCGRCRRTRLRRVIAEKRGALRRNGVFSS